MQEQEWKALARIQQQPEGRKLVEMLKAEREECRDQLETCRDNSEGARLQGQAAAIGKLIERLESAREVVEKRYT